MNLTRIALAAFGAFIAYFILGGIFFGALPFLRAEFAKYPAVYRDKQAQLSHMPGGMAAMFLAILALAVIYALLYPAGSSIAQGARFGALIGVFFVGSSVVHNYVNLNIGLKLTLQQAAAYFVEWTAVGIVIGLIYHPVTP
jgi:hypothetical protein